MTCFIPLTSVGLSAAPKIVSINPSHICSIEEHPEKSWFDGKEIKNGCTEVNVNCNVYFVEERMFTIMYIIQDMENHAERYHGWVGNFIKEATYGKQKEEPKDEV